MVIIINNIFFFVSLGGTTSSSCPIYNPDWGKESNWFKKKLLTVLSTYVDSIRLYGIIISNYILCYIIMYSIDFLIFSFDKLRKLVEFHWIPSILFFQKTWKNYGISWRSLFFDLELMEIMGISWRSLFFVLKIMGSQWIILLFKENDGKLLNFMELLFFL